MYEQVDKSNENKSRAVANSVAQKKSSVKQGFGFVDNRPEALSLKSLQRMINKTSENSNLHGKDCPCCSSNGGVALRKKAITNVSDNCITQLKDDMMCKAIVDIKGTKYEGTGMNNQDYASSAENTIGTWNALNSKLTTVKQKTNQSIFGCAEPVALADAVGKMKQKDKISKKKDVKITISDAKMKKAFPSQGLAVGDTKPRCVNCEQWVPGNEVKI